jgi:kumamolisin
LNTLAATTVAAWGQSEFRSHWKASFKVFSASIIDRQRNHVLTCFELTSSPEWEELVRFRRPFHWWGSFPTIPQLAQLYTFPPGDGTGQTIGIIELGGGIVFSDLPVFFKRLGLRQPQVSIVSIDGGASNPNQNDGRVTLEVMQDIEVAGAVAPGSNIVVYFAPDATDQSFLNAVLGAVFDPINDPSVISISWGKSEDSWTPSAMRVMDQAFQFAAMLGRTVFCGSGDNGSSDKTTDNRAHVSFPASSPSALACGGTSLTASGIVGAIDSEVVWENGPGMNSGGGVSDVFALPLYQNEANVPKSANPEGNRGRGVPDVCGHAASSKMLFFGQEVAAAGTSMVAPLWAGLVALLNENLGKRVGLLHPQLYRNPEVLRDVTSGSNGAYQAGPGWDACTGLGSPNGVALLQALKGFLLNIGTSITEADAGNFQFVAGDFDQDGLSDLLCIKISNTGTNSMEVHILNGADNFQTFLLHTGTAFSEADSAHLQFGLGDFNGDGIPDLYCLKVSNTGTKSLEVHVLNGADNFQSFLLRVGTPILEADAANFQFAIGDFNRDGVLDLYCVKLTNTGTSSLEVHVLDGKDHFQSFLLHTGTSITSAEAANFHFFASGDFDQDGVDDLYCIKVHDTGTNSVEVHILNGADNFRSFLLRTGTAIPQADAGNFRFALGKFNRDVLHLPDLYCEKISNTGTNSLEVHILNGATL